MLFGAWSGTIGQFTEIRSALTNSIRKRHGRNKEEEME